MDQQLDLSAKQVIGMMDKGIKKENHDYDLTKQYKSVTKKDQLRHSNKIKALQGIKKDANRQLDNGTLEVDKHYSNKEQIQQAITQRTRNMAYRQWDEATRSQRKLNTSDKLNYADSLAKSDPSRAMDVVHSMAGSKHSVVSNLDMFNAENDSAVKKTTVQRGLLKDIKHNQIKNTHEPNEIAKDKAILKKTKPLDKWIHTNSEKGIYRNVKANDVHKATDNLRKEVGIKPSAKKSPIWGHDQISEYAGAQMRKLYDRRSNPKITPKQANKLEAKAGKWLSLQNVANNAMPEPSTKKPFRAYASAIKDGSLAKEIPKVHIKPKNLRAINSSDIERRNKKLFNFSKKRYLKNKIQRGVSKSMSSHKPTKLNRKASSQLDRSSATSKIKQFMPSHRHSKKQILRAKRNRGLHR